MLKSNILANFVGRIWPSLLSVILVPVYLQYLGVEAYGLVGFFVSLQALISFLDLGLGTTTNREVALGLNASEKKQSIRDLVYTFEIVYGAVALLIMIGFYSASHWLATDWINAEKLSIDTIRLAAIVFGATLALRWPMALYSGVLQGSERQALYNGLSIVLATVRGVGSVMVVAFVSRTILAYLLWQFVFAFVELPIMRGFAWMTLHMEGFDKPRRDFSMFRKVWRFSASVSFNSVLAAFLKQMDRVLISNLLLLQQVGYYSTAHMAYTAISLFATPFSTAAFPRFTALIADQNRELLAATYHRLAQSVSFIVTPIASVMFFYSYDILLIWTRSQEIAINAAPTLSVLAMAAMFNLMMYIPHMLQLAAGITWIALWNNVISLTILLPFMYYLISHFGIAGAGVAWVIFNLSYYLIVPHIMHRHILPGEKTAWMFKDTLPFMALSFIIFGGAYWLKSASNFPLVLSLAGGGIFYSFACLAFFPLLRDLAQDFLTNNALIQRLRRN